MSTHKTYNRKVKLRILKPILIANCFSKFYLIYLGKKDGRKGVPFINDSSQTSISFETPAIVREYSRVEKCMSIVEEQIYRKNIQICTSIMNSIIKFEQSAFEYERLYNRLKDKLKEDDIIIPQLNSSSNEEEMLKSKRDSEQDLDPFGIRLRRFNEYQRLLKPMRTRLIEARKEVINQYQEIMFNVKQLNSIDISFNTIYVYYSSKVIKRISWYWQGVLLKHPIKKMLPLFPNCTKESDIKKIHNNRKKVFEEKLKFLEKRHEEILKLPEL